MAGTKGVYNLMSDESQELDHLIEVMDQLKHMVKDLDRPYANHDLLISLICILIKNTKVPDVTILPNIKEVALA